MFKRRPKKKSRSGSESKNADKVVVPDNAPEAYNGYHGHYDEAADFPPIPDADGSPNTKDQKSYGIKRTGSKLLSMFRKWKSGSSQSKVRWSSGARAREKSIAAAEEVHPPLSRDAVADQIGPLAQFLAGEVYPTSLETSHPEPNTMNTSDRIRTLRQASMPSDTELTESSVLYIPPRHDWAEHGGSRLRKSTSSLKNVIAHRLSDPFMNSTVVRRPNLRARPSVRSITHRDLLENLALEASALETTDPSTQTASANTFSAPGVSTGLTSLFSDGSSKQCTTTKNKSQPRVVRSRDSTVLEDLHLNSLAPIPETLAVRRPSIATVELTANAKIFFETHFNNILSTPVSPRSQRRRAFELEMQSKLFTSEQQDRMRRELAKQESQHLRQMRSVMSRRSDRSGVVIGGYEVVNVLGKGSFGVVRLVKEKEPIQIPENQHTSGLPNLDRSFIQPTPTAIGAVKSSVKAPRHHFRRREPTPMRHRYYAMKVIRKSNMLRNSQEGHLRAERDFLVASEGSRWIVPLIASFQDYTNLYLVMEYMVGGDFLGLLIREHTLEEDVTKWYIAEMILCVEEAHKLNWIHRDVKPDNFLISASGHLKISDFGLAFDGHWSHDQKYFHHQRYSLMDTLGIEIHGDSLDRRQEQTIAGPSKMTNTHIVGNGKRRKTEDGPSEEASNRERILDWRNKTEMRSMAKSTVGTSQYMAPEIIRNERYDGRCDWWSVGIITFEQHGTSLSFPEDIEVSPQALDFMKRLLREKEFRLSSRKYADNDFRCTRQPRGNDFGVSSDYLGQPPPARFVYPDDAKDIKAHPLFRNVPWDRLHLIRPPFVPKVKSWEDTRYFDEDEPISDVQGSSCYSNSNGRSSTSSHLGPHAATNNKASPHASLWNANDIHASIEQPAIEEKPTTKGKENKDRKRPRDKILRDPDVGKQALDIRKKGAFLGYTWRRIHPRASGTANQSLHDLTDNPKQPSRRKSLFSFS
ncbi:MAG: hypothetical protein M1816_002157 [Peltula sp. TS41687]|nr:MAG: hypothetical protein M1816_002157 [Peltula sp. TS41687]